MVVHLKTNVYINQQHKKLLKLFLAFLKWLTSHIVTQFYLPFFSHNGRI